MDLHSGTPFWLLVNGLGTVVPPLDRDLERDVAVIGAGITGALAADELVRRGCSVVVLDRRDLGQGSTLASTALLQYDTDVPLHRLVGLIGRERAVRAFRLGIEAIDTLGGICRDLGCGFEHRPSLYVCMDGDGIDELREEHRIRREAGIHVRWIGGAELRSGWGIEGSGAIRSAVAAQTDPYALCHALLRRAMAGGAAVHDRTSVTELRDGPGGVVLRTDRGPTVRARYVIHATGYEAATLLRRGAVNLQSTYAFISEPLAPNGDLWRDKSLLWEYATPYLYVRWVGDRMIVGGEDEEFADEQRRDGLLPAKTESLVRKFARVAPGLQLEPAFAWTGTFASTEDGLGYIGPLPGRPRVLLALGFGGNGITCSTLAARFLAEHIVGLPNPDAGMFGLGRASAGADGG